MSVKDWMRAAIPHPIWERLRRARTRHHVRSFKPYIARHRYGHTWLGVQIADGLAQGWYDHDWDALPELTILARGKLKPGALVFDCGAHQAVVAMMIRQCIQPGGHVVAIEATEHNFRKAQENLRLNGFEGEISVVHAAIAAETGRVQFTDGLNGHVDQSNTGKWIDAVTIDALADRFGEPDVLFVDVEGFECQALRGAARTLRSRPDCYIEVHVGAGLEESGGSVAEVIRIFDSADYELWAWSTDTEPSPAPFRLDSPLVGNRFCLVALSKSLGRAEATGM